MDYEKKYKEALERAKAYQGLRSEMEIIFPELKESEGEKTKRLLHTIANKMSQHLRDIFTEEEFQCFDAWSNAWLEKQGEQKPAPKHRVGDTIYYNSFGELKSMIVANVVTDSTDNPMYEDKEGNAVFEKDIIEQNLTWSEEDEEIHRRCICAMRASACGFPEEEKFVEQVDNWLESLKDRVRLQNGYNPYKEVVESIAEMCEKYKLPTSDLSDFFDNVKVKCKEAKEFDAMFPQNMWKPSEEQLEAVDVASRNIDIYDYKEALESLYNNLKAL